MSHTVCMRNLITVIDHGNSMLVCSELELFVIVESWAKSRIFKKIE